ncbi:hypothetical protein GCM10009867_23360 [Pedococcus aerophilus]|uniref:DUF4352 domain-containing protein n=1 Tax=Pedococcus aerophilus TaxID=436356 RepID=A0ABN3UQP9_9MICO
MSLRRLTAALAVGLVGAALVSGCSSDPTTPTAASRTGAVGAVSSSGTSTPSASATSSATTKGSATTEPSQSPTTSATVAPPLPQPVQSVPKVKRSGGATTPSVTAPAAKFSAPVKYPDGVRLEIVKTNRATETGHGPGVMAGREYVRFQLKLTNGSAKAINLNEVVLTTYYSSSKQLAAPVYTESAKTYDFSGTVAPGKSATAYYAFAVPDSGLKKLTMVVDFDGLHTSATYTGAVVLS